MNNSVLHSIRGAIIAENTVEDISEKAIRLVKKIYFKNGLTDGNVVNIMFTLTGDLTAFSPATAVRGVGVSAPLFCAVEPETDGGMKNCIRVMVTAYCDKAHHVYLNGARALRRDLTDNYAIAIDGPSGAGKSTVAKLVADALEIAYLDTGALYRALGLKCLDCGVEPNDAVAVQNLLENVDVSIAFADGKQRVMLDGADVTGRIRTPEVSMAASAVSAIPYVRKKLLGLQRGIASGQSVILDGRDIGTVVLPDAEFKFFLTASANVRARRRYNELRAKGKNVDYDDVYNDVVTRDKNDSSRAIAPLKCAVDGVTVDSDNMTAEEVAKFIIECVTEDVEP